MEEYNAKHATPCVVAPRYRGPKTFNQCQRNIHLKAALLLAKTLAAVWNPLEKQALDWTKKYTRGMLFFKSTKLMMWFIVEILAGHYAGVTNREMSHNSLRVHLSGGNGGGI